MHRHNRFAALIISCLAVALGLTFPVWAQETQGKKDHGMIYKQAVDTIDRAEKKLTAGYTAEAKALLKESNSLFNILQSELSQELPQQQMAESQMSQEQSNKKLADDSLAQGERLEKSAQEKEAKSAELEKKGQDQQSIKLQGEAKKEYELAQKAFLKAQIYSLRNRQLTFSFLTRR